MTYFHIIALTCTRCYRRTRRRCGPRRLLLPPSSAAAAAAAAEQQDLQVVAVPGRCCKRARPLVPSRPQRIITDGTRDRRTSVTRGGDIIIINTSKQRGAERDRFTNHDARQRRR